MSAAPIVITMGDPAGVGPEVICKALADLPTAELGAGLAKPSRALKVFGLQVIFPVDQTDQTGIENDAGVSGLEEFFCLTGALESR